MERTFDEFQDMTNRKNGRGSTQLPDNIRFQNFSDGTQVLLDQKYDRGTTRKTIDNKNEWREIFGNNPFHSGHWFQRWWNSYKTRRTEKITPHKASKKEYDLHETGTMMVLHQSLKGGQSRKGK